MKKKVLQIIGSLHIGGAETVAMNIYRHVDRNKYEIDYLVYTDDEGEYEKEVYNLGGKVFRIPFYSISRKEYAKRLQKILSENGPYDIVHSHLMFHNGLALSVAKKFGIKLCVSHAHSTSTGGDNSLLRHFLDIFYTRYERYRIHKYADVHLACGDDSAVFLYGKNVTDKVVIIENGIDLNKYKFDMKIREQIRSQYNISECFTLGLAAHFQKVKNHIFLIEVFEKVLKIIPNSKLLLMGDGPLKSDIEEIVQKKGLTKNISILGNVTNVNEILQGIDLVVMPSLFEGLPISLVEAQASGLKCVVSNRICTEVNYTGNIIYLPLTDINEWVDKIVSLREYERHSCIDILEEEGLSVVSSMKKIEKIYDEV